MLQKGYKRRCTLSVKLRIIFQKAEVFRQAFASGLLAGRLAGRWFFHFGANEELCGLI